LCTAVVRRSRTLVRGCGIAAVTVGLLLSGEPDHADALEPLGDGDPVELPLDTLISAGVPEGAPLQAGPRAELVPEDEGLAARLTAVPEEFIQQVVVTVNREHTARRLVVRDVAAGREHVAQRRTDRREAAQYVRELTERATRRLQEREAQEREAQEREAQEREAQEREAQEREAQEREARQRSEQHAADHAHWDRLADCESGNWIDGGQSFEPGSARWDWARNGVVPPWGTTIHHGGLQFLPSTWGSFKPAGFPARAYDASRSQQIEVGERVLAAQGWGAWPVCSRKVGLR